MEGNGKAIDVCTDQHPETISISMEGVDGGIRAYVDTGADISFMPAEGWSKWLQQMDSQVEDKVKKPYTGPPIVSFHNHLLWENSKIFTVELKLGYEGIYVKREVLIVPEPYTHYDIWLGRDILKQFLLKGIHLPFFQNQVNSASIQAQEVQQEGHNASSLPATAPLKSTQRKKKGKKKNQQIRQIQVEIKVPKRIYFSIGQVAIGLHDDKDWEQYLESDQRGRAFEVKCDPNGSKPIIPPEVENLCGKNANNSGQSNLPRHEVALPTNGEAAWVNPYKPKYSHVPFLQEWIHEEVKGDVVEEIPPEEDTQPRFNSPILVVEKALASPPPEWIEAKASKSPTGALAAATEAAGTKMSMNDIKRELLQQCYKGEATQLGADRLTKLRVCLDARALNRVLLPVEEDELPMISNILNTVAGKKFFSSLDLKSAFNQLPLAKEDRNKTAFTLFGKRYRYKRATFGLAPMSGIFQRAMNTLLRGIEDVYIFIDDILIATDTYDRHTKVLCEVIGRLNEANFLLNREKCKFYCPRLAILGHVVDSEGVRIAPEKMSMVNDWEIPTTGKDLQRFMGLCSYLRNFVPAFSELQARLTRLIPMKRIELTAEYTSDILQLKTAIMESIVLAPVDPKLPFTVRSDASNQAIGAVLLQRHPETGQERIIQLASRTLRKYERNYEVYKKELLALVYALTEFRAYLHGRLFLLQTDHEALSHLHKPSNTSPTLLRWLDLIEDYTFHAEYLPGLLNVTADALSRMGEAQPNRPLASHLLKPHFDYRLPEEMQEAKAERQPDQATHEFELSPLASLGVRVLTRSARAASEPTEQHSSSLASSRGEVVAAPLSSTQRKKKAAKKKNKRVKTPMAAEETDDNKQFEGDLSDEDKSDSEAAEDPTQEESRNLVVPSRSKYHERIEKDLKESDMQEDPIRYAHVITSHGGRDVMMAYAKKYQLKPFTKQEAQAFVNECLQCARYGRGTEFRAPLSHIEALHPMDRLQMDIKTFQPAPSGAAYLLVVVDCATSFTWLFPLKSKEPKEIGIKLAQTFATFGCPKVLQSDGGGEFANQIINELVSEFNIERHISTAYHPATNGKVERRIQSIADTIYKLLDGKKNWDEHIWAVQMAYNDRACGPLKCSPNALMFGREANLFRNYSETKDMEADVEELQQAWENYHKFVYPVVADKTKDHYDKQGQRFQSKKKIMPPTKFAKGDWVMVRVPASDNKQAPKFEGPYQIAKKQASGRVNLLKNDASPYHRVVNVSELKQYSTKKMPLIYDNTAYLAEKIIKHKVKDGSTIYQVRWKGYTAKDDSWEPVTSFYSPELIHAYWSSQANAKDVRQKQDDDDDDDERKAD